MTPRTVEERAPIATDSLGASGHIPQLDGIRGLAVLLVMVLHFTLHGKMGEASAFWADQHFLRITLSGWIGVDLFFVMSGFLITGILWNTKEREGYFRVFYGRRFLRIFPLYYGYLAVRLLIVPMFFPELTVAPQAQALYWTYLSNTLPILQNVSDSFSDIGRPVGLFHFWSLAVEEQFYLFWPLLVWKLNRQHLMRLCVALTILAPVFRLALSYTFEPEAGKVFTLARVDALAIGAYCALAIRGGEIERLRRWVGPVVLVCLPILSVIFYMRGRLSSSDPYMHGIGFTAVALIGAGLLIRSLDKPGMFGWKWLQWLGGLCYGLYVFNGPLGHLMGKYLPVTTFPPLFGSYLPAQMITLAVGLSINILVAWVVWHGFEKHFNNLKVYLKHGPNPVTVRPPQPVLAPGGD